MVSLIILKPRFFIYFADKFVLIPLAELASDEIFPKTNTKIVLSITGVAGPDGGTKINPVGTVYFTIGYYDEKKMLFKTIRKQFKNNTRIKIQKKSAAFAVDLILKTIN